MHEAMNRLKKADFVYYADTLGVPYGTKTKAQVREFVFTAADFLVRIGIDVLVVACNTATSVAIEDLRKEYALPIIGMEPAVKPAVENHKDKRILVTATALTLKEEKLKKLITRLDCEYIVDLLPLPGLVEFAEQGIFDEDMVRPYLLKALGERDISQYQTAVLGCTHFIFYKPVFKKLLGQDIDIIDGNSGTVNMLVKTLEANAIHAGGNGKVTYYHSGAEVRDGRTLEKYDRLLRRLSVP